MHSCIYQISKMPLSPDEYASPETYYENSDDFADYIGNSYKGDERAEHINIFAEIICGVFDYQGNDVFVYKGPSALYRFKKRWAEEIKTMAQKLNAADPLFYNSLYHIGCVTKKTHLFASSRVDIEGWTGGIACPLESLFIFAGSELKAGDRIYIGAVIDYHF